MSDGWTGDPLDAVSVEAADAACERAYQQGRKDVLDAVAAADRGYLASRVELIMRAYARRERTRRETVEHLVGQVLTDILDCIPRPDQGKS